MKKSPESLAAKKVLVVDDDDALRNALKVVLESCGYLVTTAANGKLAEHLISLESFDCVVSTFTLCTIPDPIAALQQMRRVLKPGGKLYFAEHGLSPDPKVQRWQHRMNGFNNRFFGGCNANRDIRKLVSQAGFSFDQVDQYYMQGGPKFATYMTRGVASAA